MIVSVAGVKVANSYLVDASVPSVQVIGYVPTELVITVIQNRTSSAVVAARIKSLAVMEFMVSEEELFRRLW